MNYFEIDNWTNKMIRATDTLETLGTFQLLNEEERFRIFSLLLSDDKEMFQLGINIIEEKSKEL